MRTLFLLLVVGLFVGCSKEKLQTNAVMEAMTNGQWKVVKFIQGSQDVTAEFSPYAFQFRENQTVEALKSGSIEKTGTWSADANTRTITSNFTNAAATLALLNATWKITNNGWTFVEASVTLNNEMRLLRLEKL